MLQELFKQGMTSPATTSPNPNIITPYDISGCQLRTVVTKIDGPGQSRPMIPGDINRFADEFIRDMLHSNSLYFQENYSVERSIDNTAKMACRIPFLVWDGEAYHLVTRKVGYIPKDGPREEWVDEIHFMLALFRDYIQEGLEDGEAMPFLQGHIVCVDLNKKTAHVFHRDDKGWQLAYNEEKAASLMFKASNISNCIRMIRGGQMERDEVPKFPTPKCNYCFYLQDCPAFQGEEWPDLEDDIADLKEKDVRAKALDKEVKAKKQQLLSLMEGLDRNWFRVNGCKVARVEKSRESVQKDAVKNFLVHTGYEVSKLRGVVGDMGFELSDLGIDPDALDFRLERLTKKTSFAQLDIKEPKNQE